MFFAKTSRPVLEFICINGLRAALFVDDWLLVAPDDICAQSDFLIATLEDIGWSINNDN